MRHHHHDPTMGGGTRSNHNSTHGGIPDPQSTYLSTPPASFNSFSSASTFHNQNNNNNNDNSNNNNNNNHTSSHTSDTTITPTRKTAIGRRTSYSRIPPPETSTTWTKLTPQLRSPSMSPDPVLVFPTLTISPRATPEPDDNSSSDYASSSRDVSREPSPEARESSPARMDEEDAEEDWDSRSRSASPETTMRPPPLPNNHHDEDEAHDALREISGTVINARNYNRPSSRSSSVISFDMVASYQSVSPADRKAGVVGETITGPGRRIPAVSALQPPASLDRQQSYYSFHPNAGLGKAITPSFLRDYGTVDPVKQAQAQAKEMDVERSPKDRRGSPFASGKFPQLEPIRRRTGVLNRQMSAPVESVGLGESADMSSGSTNGMESFFTRLDRDREAKGWHYGTFPSHAGDLDDTHLATSCSINSELGGERRQRDSLSAVYRHEFSSQFHTILHHVKTPLVSITLFLSIFSLLYLTTAGFNLLFPPPTTSLSALSASPSSPSNSTYHGLADFTTLMNIESAFERVVDSAAGGSELARSLKNSEMAVSDLSAVVRHSDLKCRATLSQRLERFADDARFNVQGLLAFASDVGGVLDQLLSVNQYALRELQSLSSLSASPSLSQRLLLSLPLPTVLRPTPPHPPQNRLSEIFDTAAESLESNLRTLLASGSAIATALDDLALQHKPIHEEIIREFSDIRKASSAAMSSLWSRLYGHGPANFRENERLLEEIHTYQDKARGYVEVTLMELRRMMSEMEGLRRRVAEPILVGGMVGGKEGKRGVGEEVEVVRRSVEGLERKRREREERVRKWNRLILERETRRSESGGAGRTEVGDGGRAKETRR